MLNLNTFSIVARDPASGMLGVSLSTKFPAVGATCSFARAGVGAIVTQARTNPLMAINGLDLLEEGYGAEEALRKLLDSDHEPERRQLAVVDARGATAAHTGTATDPWCGHLTGPGYAVAGNLLVGEETIAAMAEAFEVSLGHPLPKRLVRALEAGQIAGGDRRGRQSAALYVVESQPYPYLDLRVEVTDELYKLRVRETALADGAVEVYVLDDAFENGVVLFEGAQSNVQAGTDVVVQLVADAGPAGCPGDEEGLAVAGRALSALNGLFLGETTLQGAGNNPGISLVEDVGAAFQEEHPEDVLLELRGVHLAAQNVSGGE